MSALQIAIDKQRALTETRRAQIASGSTDYPKLTAWLALHADSVAHGEHVLTLARAEGRADFDPDEQAKAGEEAGGDVDAIAARIAGYAA